MDIWNEIRYSFRQVQKSPLIAAAGILAIGLGVASCATMFSVTDAFLWKPAPFPNGERVMMFHERDSRLPEFFQMGFSAHTFERWRAGVTKLDAFSAWWSRRSTLGLAQGPESKEHTLVTGDFFRCLGINAGLGRMIQPSDTVEGRGSIVVLSHRLWKQAFQADPQIVGRTVLINDVSFEVVGVGPERFDYPQRTDFWTPAAWTPADRVNRGNPNWVGVALLKPGATLAEAEAELNVVSAQLAKEFAAEQGNRTPSIGPVREMTNGLMTKRYSLLCVVAALFVLLIACTNVANLQFTQAAGRMSEIAVRISMGASRLDVLRLLLIQSCVIAVLGAGFGILLAVWWVDLVVRSMPPEVERFLMGWSEIGVDYRTLAFVGVLTCASGVLAGVLPAWRTGKANVAGTLREAGRSGFAGRMTTRIRAVLIVAQLAVSVVLLSGAALMGKGFLNLMERTQAMRPESILVGTVELPLKIYQDLPALRARYEALSRNLESSVPGARVAVVDGVPFGNYRVGGSFRWSDEAAPKTDPRVNLITASEGYAALVGARLIEGRWLSAADGAEAAPVAVVAAGFARKFAGGRSPVGRELVINNGETYRVVGVVSDVDENSFQIAQPPPVIYRSFLQAPARRFDLLLQPPGGTDVLAVAGALRTALRGADAGAVLSAVHSFAKIIHNERIGLAYIASLLVALGVIALALSTVGLFALVAYGVAERSHEFGIRMATGAAPGDILKLVMSGGLRLGGLGLLIGVPGAVALAQVLSGLLFGIEAHDVWVFSSVVLGFLAIVVLACVLPARRAAGTSPLVILQRQ